MTSRKRNHVEIESKTTTTTIDPLVDERDLSRGLLSSVYNHVTVLGSVLPEDILQSNDSDAFRTLLETTLIGSAKKVQLEVEMGGSQMQMKEVSTESLFSR